MIITGCASAAAAACRQAARRQLTERVEFRDLEGAVAEHERHPPLPLAVRFTADLFVC